MGVFDDLRADAIAAIKENGQPGCKLLVITDLAPDDPDLPHRVGPSTPAEVVHTAVVYDVEPGGADSYEGGLDREAIVPGDIGTTPDESMRYADASGTEYAIAYITSYNPDGSTQVGWKLRLKRWPRQPSPSQGST